MPNTITETTDLSTLDRGNTIEPVDTAAADAAAAAAAATATAEAEAAEALAKAGEKKPAGDLDENGQPRDAGGKFVKKDDDAAGAVGVPKARFDEAVGKERAARIAAESRAAELQAKIDAAAHGVDAEKLESEISELEKQHTKLLMEGNGDKATEVMREIRLKERTVQRLENERNDAERAKKTAAEDAVASEKQRVNDVIADVMDKHPEFDDKNPDTFNGKLVNFALAEQARLITEEGLSPSEALRRAVDDIMEVRGEQKSLTDATTETKGKDLAAERKAAAVAKALLASQGQPGSMKEIGMDSDKTGTNQVEAEDAGLMSYEEFSALPEATKARMRGDTI